MKPQHEILCFFGRKQQEIVVILTAILRRIARVAKAANDKLADIAKGCAVTDIEVPVFAFASSTPDSVGLSFINAVPILLNDPQALPHVMVRIFWNSLRVQPVVDHSRQRGTTWIELFAFFAITGGVALVHPKGESSS